MHWLYKIKEEPDGLILLKLKNVVKGYMQAPRIEYTESFSSVATYMSTRIIIGITLYLKEEEYFSEICDAESAFLHSYISVEMFIKWPEVIADLGIITK